MNKKIYNITNNLLDSLFDDADKGICSNITYKNQSEALPDDYIFDFSEFKGTIDNILEKYQEKNIDYDIITIDPLTEPKLIKKEPCHTTNHI